MLAILSNARGTPQEGCLHFESWDKLKQSGANPEGIWISASWCGDIHALGKEMRSSALWHRHLHSELPHSSALIDGNCTLGDALRKAHQLDFAVKQIRGIPEHFSDIEKLLFFMAIRQGYELAPQFDRASKSRYVYPMVQALSPELDSPQILARYVAGGLLEPSRLVDRVRLCRQCGGAHLSYVEVCPSCASIAIRHAPSLHCFACGHVARKATFQVGGTLACPKCEARLRHIGVDYDLPMAQYICAHCNEASMEAPVVGRCYDCGKVDSPELLDVTEVYALTLGEQGMESIRQGHLSTVSGRNGGRDVMPGRFRELLDWSSNTQRRYQSSEFGVVLIEFGNTGELLDHYGSHRVSLMLAEFGERMGSVIRDCDISSSDSLERIWVLLPSTAPESTAVRLGNLVGIAEAGAGPAPEVRIRTFHSRHDMGEHDDSRTIMHKMLAS